jgi:mannose-6-phosphate isomerase-like protein (cupin superfamily)
MLARRERPLRVIRSASNRPPSAICDCSSNRDRTFMSIRSGRKRVRWRRRGINRRGGLRHQPCCLSDSDVFPPRKNMQIAISHFQPHQSRSPHKHHDLHEVFVCESGEIDLTSDTEGIHLGRGDGVRWQVDQKTSGWMNRSWLLRDPSPCRAFSRRSSRRECVIFGK